MNVVTPPNSNYEELYDEVAAEDVGDFFKTFDHNQGETATQRLSKLVDDASRVTKILLYVARHRPTGKLLVRFVHGLFRFVADVNSPSQWDNRVFGFHDDVDDSGFANVLEIPENCLGRVGPIYVPKLDQLDAAGWAALLGTNVDAEAFGPFKTNRTNTESASTLTYMGVPSQLANRIMVKQDRTPKEFWEDICQPLVGTDVEDKWEAFLDWGRITCTWADKNLHLLSTNEPYAPMVNPELRKTISSKISKDLPGLGVSPTTPVNRAPTGSAAPTATAATPFSPVEKLMAEYLKLKAAKEGPQPISKKCPGLEHLLSKLFGTEDEEQFPVFWKKFANATKASRGILLTHHLRQQAMSKRGTGSYPAVTPGLVDTIAQAKVGSEQQSQLEEGLTFFAMVVSVGASAEANQQTLIYEVALDGSAQPTVGELRELVKSQAQLPKTCLEALKQMKSLVTVAQLTLGEDQPWTVHLEGFVQAVETELSQFEAHWSLKKGGVASGLAQVFYAFHTVTVKYFNRVFRGEVGDMCALPNYQHIVSAIEHENYFVLPTVPERYLKPISEEKKLPRSEGSSGNGGNQDKTSSSKKKKAGEAKEEEQPVINGAPHEQLIAKFEAANVDMRALVSDTSKTRAFVDGTSSRRENQICLKYHLSKACHSGCFRSSSHRKLTSSEQAKVAQFITDVAAE